MIGKPKSFGMIAKEAVAEARRLQDDNDRLRAALIEALNEDYQDIDGPDNAWRLAFFRVKGILRRALELKT